VKRSRSIRLVLIGGWTAGALTGCDPGAPKQPPPASASNVYTNNHFLPGVGYYHAPFRDWYALPYNHYDAVKQRYYHGGLWAPAPHESITNISPPTAEAVHRAEAQRTDVTRSGFGSTSRHHSTYS
jgi:hypothetical protein